MLTRKVNRSVNTLTIPQCKITYMERVSDRIKQLRKERGLTQQQMADKVGVTRPAITMWESGDSKSIKSKYIFKIASVFKVSAEWLETGKMPKEGVQEDDASYSGELLDLQVKLDALPDDRRQIAYDLIHDVVKRLTPEKQQSHAEKAHDIALVERASPKKKNTGSNVR